MLPQSDPVWAEIRNLKRQLKRLQQKRELLDAQANELRLMANTTEEMTNKLRQIAQTVEEVFEDESR